MGKGRAPAIGVLNDGPVVQDERGVAEAGRTRALPVLGGPERIRRNGGTEFDMIGQAVGGIDGGRHLVKMNWSVFAVARKAELIAEAALSDLCEKKFSN